MIQTTLQKPAAPAIARGGSWLGLVLKAALFLAVSLGLTETFWRILQYEPADSDIRHFAKLRKAADGDCDAVAVVGSSRVRYGLNPELLARSVPGRRFRQLGILGNGAMPVLEDLANDANFEGRVICELNPAHWGGPYPFSKLPEALAYMHPEVNGAYLETVLGERFREHASFFSYNLLTEAPRIVQHKPVPEPERPDRFTRFRDLGPSVNEPLIHNWEHAALEAAGRMKNTDRARMTERVERCVCANAGRRQTAHVGGKRLSADAGPHTGGAGAEHASDRFRRDAGPFPLSGRLPPGGFGSGSLHPASGRKACRDRVFQLDIMHAAEPEQGCSSRRRRYRQSPQVEFLHLITQCIARDA
jgi:hypothetical protein